jgi:hypothetical protein
MLPRWAWLTIVVVFWVVVAASVAFGAFGIMVALVIGHNCARDTHLCP